MPVLHNYPPPAPLVKSGKVERMVDPKRLTQHQRGVLWLGIKQEEPELATLLKEDDLFNDLKQQLNANVRFSVSDANRFMQIGQRVFQERQK